VVLDSTGQCYGIVVTNYISGPAKNTGSTILGASGNRLQLGPACIHSLIPDKTSVLAYFQADKL